jgi:hypothetical protein
MTSGSDLRLSIAQMVDREMIQVLGSAHALREQPRLGWLSRLPYLTAFKNAVGKASFLASCHVEDGTAQGGRVPGLNAVLKIPPSERIRNR